MKRLLIPALAPLLLLAACDTKTEAPAKPFEATETRTVATAPASPPAAAPTGAFQRDPQLNADGYYYNDPTVKIGKWELNYLNISAPAAFADWEAGKRQAPMGPIVLVLEDFAASAIEGQSHDATHVYLQADSYRIDKQVFEFHGKDARLGEVSFSGKIDFDALKAGQGGSAPILVGNLKVGSEQAQNLKFHHRMTD